MSGAGTDEGPENRLGPLSDVSAGIQVYGLPTGFVPVEGFLLLLGSDSDGDETWLFRKSPGMDLDRLFAQLTIQVELIKRQLLEVWDED